MTRRASRDLLAEVNAALLIVAELLHGDDGDDGDDGEAYEPVFRRLLQEKEALEEKRDLRSVAQTLLESAAAHARCAGTGKATFRTMSNLAESVSPSP